MANQKRIILDTPADWDAWISLVQAQATDTQIWDSINPDLTERPTLLEKPTIPEYDLPDNASDFDPVIFKAFKKQLKIHNIEFERYNRRVHAHGDLISFIQDTITIRTAKIIQREEPYLWNLLRALKKHFAPGKATAETGSMQNCHQILEHASYDLINPLENVAAPEGVTVIEDQVPKTITTDTLTTLFEIPDLDPITQITKVEPDKDAQLIEVNAEADTDISACIFELPTPTEPASQLQLSTPVEAASRSDEISPTSATTIPATEPSTAQNSHLRLPVLDTEEESCSKSITSAPDPTETLFSTLSTPKASLTNDVSSASIATAFLSKGVERATHQRRKSEYATILKETAQWQLALFDTAFAAFATTSISHLGSQYYSKIFQHPHTEVSKRAIQRIDWKAHKQKISHYRFNDIANLFAF